MTASIPNPTCGTNYREGFFKFVATTTSSTVTVTDAVGGPDPILAVYSGSCGSLTQVGCSNNGNNNTEQVTFASVVGTTYYVAIMRNNNANANDMTGTVCVSQVAPPLSNQNCATATQICSTSDFPGNSNGYGTQDLNSSNEGCLSGENQSSWFYFQAQTSGTVAFIINTTVDYDFALWNTGCGALGSPVRCSYSGDYGDTGLQAGAGDNSEDASGDKFVNPLNVVAGHTYILLVDNFTSDNTNFSITWNFSGGATLNCNPVVLPVELVNFMGSYKGNHVNELDWMTESERNSDHFTIERSVDGINWVMVGEKTGAGNSVILTQYAYEDDAFESSINYYRLSQTDYDGKRTDFAKIVSVDNRYERKDGKRYNLLGQLVDDSYHGVVVIQFEDGSVMKTIQ